MGEEFRPRTPRAGPLGCGWGQGSEGNGVAGKPGWGEGGARAVSREALRTKRRKEEVERWGEG